MVYKILKVIVRWLLKLTHKKIYIHGKENLGEGPYFIACNHPLGFMEPLILACFLDRDLHWLVRGDMFENPVLKPLLVSTNQIPIYRSKDGFSNLRNNTGILSKVSEVLLKGAAITIFIEGSTKLVKHLRPLQKGMARMSLRTLEEAPNGHDIMILPIGMCFTESTHLREEAIVAIGKPISSREYLESYKQDRAGIITKLTDDTFSAMKECMIEVSPEREALFDDVGRMWRTTFELPFWPVEINDPSRFNAEKSMAASIDELSEEESQSLKDKVYAWLDQYNNLKVGYNPLTGMLGLVGWIGNYIPMRLARWFADTVIESPEFYATIRMVASLVAFLVYYITIAIAVLYNPAYFWVPIAFALLGIIYLYHKHQEVEKRKNIIPSELISERDDILKSIHIQPIKQKTHHD
jgi:1-acyl-sn-glycerol-3-phosphate acyltransferase